MLGISGLAVSAPTLEPEKKAGRNLMEHNASQVSRLILHGLNNGLAVQEVEELVHKQFPGIASPIMWESYNIALLALARGVGPESTVPTNSRSMKTHN